MPRDPNKRRKMKFRENKTCPLFSSTLDGLNVLASSLLGPNARRKQIPGERACLGHIVRRTRKRRMLTPY